MNKRFFSSLTAAALVLAAVLPASAQWSAGNTGSQSRQTTTTWEDVLPLPAPGNFDAGVGNTFRTAPQSQPGLNGPSLPYANTPMEAPRSGMSRSIPSGQYSCGFPSTGPDQYRGPYSSSSRSGGMLPPTATSSVNANCVDFAPMASSASCLPGGCDGGGGGCDGGGGGGGSCGGGGCGGD